MNPEQVVELKLEKSRAKTVFTKTKNRLLNAIDAENIDKTIVKELSSKLDNAIDNVMITLEKLCVYHKNNTEYEDASKVSSEIDMINNEYSETTQTVYNKLRRSASTDTLNTVPEESTLEKDLWRQMKRVSIPVFYGDKKKYDTWKSAFTACIDKAPATPEYKLLQLRQYLRGEALDAIDGLGHSELAYIAAKERLERKFGGERRKMMKFLDELERFPPLKTEDAKSVEKFADLLDIAIINMKEANHEDELGEGSLYLSLQRKLPEKTIARFHRWIFENKEEESVETLKNFINQEAQYLTIASETKNGLGKSYPVNRQTVAHENYPRRQTSYFTDNRAKKHVYCTVCKNTRHNIYDCEYFKSLDPASRWNKAKELGLCFRCLRNNHMGLDCKNYRRCGVNNCSKIHHRLLHKETQALNSSAQEFVPATHTSTCITESESKTTFFNAKCQIALRTVPVIVSTSADSKKIVVNALLDDGSTKTYINQCLAAQLGLQGKIEPVRINTINKKSESFETMSVNLTLESLNGLHKVEINALVLDNVTGSLRTTDWRKQAEKWPHLTGISFPSVQSKQVDMLIGLDHANLHSSLHEIHGRPGEPIARLTPLGWTCVGPVDNETVQTSLFSTYFVRSSTDDLDEMLKGFWEIDSYRTKKEQILSEQNQKIMKGSKDAIEYKDGHYEVKIPWKSDPNELPDNRGMAEKRLKQTERRLKKDINIEVAYKETIDKYLNKGYLRKVPKDEPSPESCWYLPHFPVVRPERETTKVRIVFDASAKHEGICLNDIIHTGPKLQNDLLDVLLRFRKHDIALVCDISEMYLRVGIVKTDRRFHRLLFNNEEYEFNTLVFGVNASPFLAQLVSQTNAEKYQQSYPLAAETILKSTYMDDSMDSVSTEQQALQLYTELSELWLKAGMYAKKWLSNSHYIMKNIQQADRATEVDLDTSYLPTTKALGVTWKAEEDIFTFRMNLTNNEMKKITKRNLLRRVASLFDPLGFLSPYIVLGKIFLQQCWLKGYDWDEEIEPELSGQVIDWLNELTLMNNVTVQRSLSFSEGKESELHVFVDASEVAYGTVIYVRHVDLENKITVKFVCSKSRVSPLTSVSIPKLELTASVLGLRLSVTVMKALNMLKNCVTFWTDSTNVIYWIRNESRLFKPFIANRIGEIHENSSPSQWRYIPSKENPADFTSRGLKAENLVNNSLWIEGPEFLKRSENEWPKNVTEEKEIKDNELKKSKNTIRKHKDKQTRNQQTSNTYVNMSKNEDDKLDVSRYSDWAHLVRILGWVMRFVTNCKLKKDTRNKEKCLSVDEIEDAENILIRNEQQKYYPEEYKLLAKGKPVSNNSKLLPLNVKLDENKVLRCDTRLTNAKFLPYDTRFPVILPKKSQVTKLLVKQYHEQGHHYGTNQILAAMSAKYWLVGGRDDIREWEHSCNGCKRLKAQVSRQIMAPLPPARVTKSMRAFAYCSVDYAGPFLTKQGRGKSRQKRYLCLFTCLSCRAVHLEIAFGLDTDSFLNAFYRMTSRRGFPVEIYSDNGTNFVGAQRELTELYKQIDKTKVQENGTRQKVKWHFNPPLAPHFGGVHESMVKSAKRAIYAVLNKADVTDEELLTAITGAEGLINSRPISYQTSNSKDDTVLTPNHFLHGQLGGKFAPESVNRTVFNIKRRWRFVQEIVKHFWHRWLREFLPTLSCRRKWYTQSRDLQVDDVVLIIDTDKPRGEWSLGRIINVYPGSDGLVRVVDVNVGKTVLRRPVSRLCLIQESQTSD